MVAADPAIGTLPSTTVLAELRKRAPLIAAVVAFFVIGYYTLGLHTDPARAHTLRTRLDDAIPFVAWTIFGYAWSYTFALLPVFVVRSHELFRRTVYAYLAAMAFAFACFAIYPVTSVGFRPDLATLEDGGLITWAAHFNFSADPPYNLFPSLHLATATITAYSVWKARRLFGVFAFAIAAVIAISICTCKQHFIADGVAGLVLAGVLSAWLLRPYRTELVPMAERAYCWRGFAGYLAFHATFYLAFGIAFLLRTRA